MGCRAELLTLAFTSMDISSAESNGIRRRTTRKHRVLLHASDSPGDVPKALAAAKVIVDNLPEVQVEVIVNGAALDGTLSQAELLEPEPHVQVFACALGMSRRNLHVESLQTMVGIVDSAVVALTQEQLEGAAYVRI